MNNYIKIIKGHKAVALEHVKAYGLNHTPTTFQAVLVTLDDLMHRHTIEINGAYIIYEVYNKRTLGLPKVAHINSIYVPKHLRGQGYGTRLLDAVSLKHALVISDYKGSNHGVQEDKNKQCPREIGRLYAVRGDI